MTDATELWTAVVAAYDSDGLITLTNIRDRSASAVDTTVGQAAAQSVLNLWPIYAQVAYDSTDLTHVEVAVRGVIALLWERGGSASQISKVEWGEVFGDSGLISKLRSVGPRGHQSPSTNSGTSAKTEQSSSGQNYRPWAARESYADGLMPGRRIARD